MGIKAKVVLGISGIVLTGIAAILGWKKKEDERYEKIQSTIQNVDLKEPEKEEAKNEPKTVEEMHSEITEAMQEMDIDGDELEETERETLEQEVNDIRKDVQAEIEELNRQRENYLKTDWINDVEKAKNAKNYHELERLFDMKYNPYPYHPAPSDPYGQACSEGIITDEFYEEAAKWYGRLWNYSGD